MGSMYRPGAVSIFSVIFSALLLTVMTVGFMGLMISAQQRAMNNDLSQSAYDAALAGVEDAKRAVRACVSGNTSVCEELEDSARAGDCRVIARAGINGSESEEETIISSTIAGRDQEVAFDQAYTCVNIAMDSPDYLYNATTNSSHVVPLRSTAPIRAITVEWFTVNDNNGNPLAVAPTTADIGLLPPQGGGTGGWNESAPPLMRMQLINPGEGEFSLDSLNSSAASSTFFVRPASMAGLGAETDLSLPIGEIGSIARATSDGEYISNDTYRATCSPSFSNNTYSCRATIVLSEETAISAQASQNAVLRLETIYGNATVRVSLKSDVGSPVLFDGVQPVVDSTGRASSLFRRVEARLEVGAKTTYPSYVADVQNNICKNFTVTDTGVPNAGGCTP